MVAPQCRSYHSASSTNQARIRTAPNKRHMLKEWYQPPPTPPRVAPRPPQPTDVTTLSFTPSPPPLQQLQRPHRTPEMVHKYLHFLLKVATARQRDHDMVLKVIDTVALQDLFNPHEHGVSWFEPAELREQCQLLDMLAVALACVGRADEACHAIYAALCTQPAYRCHWREQGCHFANVALPAASAPTAAATAENRRQHNCRHKSGRTSLPGGGG